MGGARLHFDKAEHGPLPRDQVDVTGPVAGRPAPRHHGVPLAPKIKEGRVLAVSARDEMSWALVHVTAPASHSVEPPQGTPQPRKPHLRHPLHRKPLSTPAGESRKRGSCLSTVDSICSGC